MDKEHKDPYKLDLTQPRLAWYKQKTWKRHQDTVYWVDIQLARRKGLKFYQTRSNASIVYDTLPAYCIPKVVVMEPGEIIYEKVCVSPRLPPKISFKDSWMKELDSEVVRQPEGEVARQAKSSHSTQPTPNPIRDRSGRPVVCSRRGAHRSQEIETRSSRDEAVSHDRTGISVVCRDANHERLKIFVFLRGLMTWLVMRRSVERYCELANRTTQQLYKVSAPCIDDHHFKEEEMKSVGELSKVCSQVVLKCLYLARIGRPDIPWSVNKLARSITNGPKLVTNV